MIKPGSLVERIRIWPYGRALPSGLDNGTLLWIHNPETDMFTAASEQLFDDQLALFLKTFPAYVDGKGHEVLLDVILFNENMYHLISGQLKEVGVGND